MVASDPIPPVVDAHGCSRSRESGRPGADQFLIAELERTAKVQHASKPALDDSRRSGARQAHLIVVTDGVDGTPAAVDASSLVVDEVLDGVLNAVPWTPTLDVEYEASLRRALASTVVRCEEQVAGVSRGEPARAATTLTMAYVRWPVAFVVHAGHSRAYLLRGGEIERLTTDHTVAEQLVRDGELDPQDAEVARFASMLFNAVGGDHRVTPELRVRRLDPGDALLLCTAGLTQHLNDGAILRVTGSCDSARDTCEELVSAAESVGGRGDLTVAMVRFEDEARQQARAADSPNADSATAAVHEPIAAAGRRAGSRGAGSRPRASADPAGR